jgi:hypothetical protein
LQAEAAVDMPKKAVVVEQVDFAQQLLQQAVVEPSKLHYL